MAPVFDQYLHTYGVDAYDHACLVHHGDSVFAFAMTPGPHIVYSVLDVGDVGEDNLGSWFVDPLVLELPTEIEQVDDPESGPNPLTPAQHTADVAFQVVADDHHIYIFRQSTTATLLVDRYVMSDNRLELAREVRYRRSKHRSRPDSPDSLGATDLDGRPFIEPTRELGFVNNLEGGFAVTLLPTATKGERWQIFAPNTDGQLLAINVERDRDGFFNLEGSTPDDVIDIVRFKLEEQLPQGGLAARVYAEQPFSAATESRPSTIDEAKTLPRVLLAATSTPIGQKAGGGSQTEDSKVAIVDFAISPSGRLAEIPTSTSLAQRDAEKDLVRAQVKRQELLDTTQEELTDLLERTPPGGRGDVRFYTADSATGFSFTVFPNGEDPDVHARYHTASRPVDNGPQQLAGAGTPGQDDPSQLAVDSVPEVEPADTDRVRFIELRNLGVIVELYSERDFRGDKIVVTESGPVPASLDVQSLRVLQDNLIIQQRAAIADKKAEIHRLEDETAEALSAHEIQWTQNQQEGQRLVRLPLLTLDRSTVTEIVTAIGDLQAEKSMLEEEVTGFKTEQVTLAQRQVEVDKARDELTRDAAQTEHGGLDETAAQSPTRSDSDAVSVPPVAPGHVRLLDRQGDMIFTVLAATELNLDVQRPEIHTVEVDGDLTAAFDVNGFFVDDVWETTTTTSDLPRGHFDKVRVRTNDSADAGLQADKALRSGDQTLPSPAQPTEAEAQLAETRQALTDLATTQTEIDDLRATNAEGLTRRQRRLDSLAVELEELSDRRFGGPRPTRLEYHSTDDDELTIRSGLLNFAATSAQPVLVEDTNTSTKMYFTGTQGQLQSAVLDHSATHAHWDLPSGKSVLPLRSKSADHTCNDLSIRIGSSYRASLCNITIAHEDQGTLEVWRNVPRDAEQLADVLSGGGGIAPLSIPLGRDHRLGSLALSVLDAPREQAAANGIPTRTVEATSPSWKTEHRGTALSFDGTVQISAADPWGFEHAYGLTVEAWVQPGSFNGSGALVASFTNGRSSYALGLQSDGTDQCGIFVEVDGTAVVSTRLMRVGEWHHVAIVFDGFAGNRPMLYVDGSAVDTSPLTGNPVSLCERFGPQFTIGAVGRLDGSYQEHFTGVVDEVRIWDVARNQQQLVDNLFAPPLTENPDLHAYYRFEHDELDENAQMSVAVDSGPQGLHLPFDRSAKPTEILSSAPASLDAAMVRCALSDAGTTYHSDGLIGRPAVIGFPKLRRCFGYTTEQTWRLVAGPRSADDALTDPADEEILQLGEETKPAAGNTLLVPMMVKGIYVDRPQRSAGPTVDFTYLPWNDGNHDHNADYAPLGEHLELPPMQNANGELQAGVHLHWTLPPALCRPVDTGGHTTLPYIPVTWDVKQIEGGDYQRTVWSDAIHPLDTPISDEHVAIPIPEHDERRSEPPYRYMGMANKGQRPVGKRMRDYHQTVDPDGAILHEQKLTSLGYGDPAFSSYYPNGREILGHHASKKHLMVGGEHPQSTTWLVSATVYDHNDPSSPLAELMADTGLSLGDLLKQMGWTDTGDEAVPDGLQHIRLTGSVKVEHTHRPRIPVADNVLDFAMGNTGTEALSAHIANTLSATYGDVVKIEEQLEAIMLGNGVHGHAADLSFKFLEQRHAQGYQTHDGGKHWRVSGSAEASRHLQETLVELNRAQEVLDIGAAHSRSAKGELFADWYKYMLAKYPPPASLEQFDQMSYPSVGESAAWLESRKSQIENLAAKQLEAQARVADLHRALSAEVEATGDGMVLVDDPAERFYSPTDPVLLISGLDLPAEHPAASLEPVRTDLFSDDWRAVFGAADSAWGSKHFIADEDGWSPFIMEWQAEFVPIVDGTSKAVPGNRFTLHEHGVDADPQETSGEPDPKPVNLQGRTYLTPGAKSKVEHSLAQFLTISLDGEAGVESTDLLQQVQEYIAHSQTPSDTNDAVLTACRAYEQLQDETVLSQSLGGFHDALLQRERHLQPNMSDPLGSDFEQQFSKAIGECVGDEERLAPNPSQPFLPVRAGSLRITRLRVIDVWGRTEDIVRDRQIEPVYAETIRPFPQRPGWAGLRPRSAQPLRLRTDWLVAGSDDVTIDDDSLGTPVLGWVMANHMDRSLMWFERNGAGIGSFDREGDFSPTPGRTHAPDIADVKPMEHFLQHASGDANWVQSFLDATDDALAQIAPREHLQHAGMAVLAGRPLAVVRAKISFELQGLPAQNQSWELFEEQLRSYRSGSDEHRTAWQDMKLPVRLGSYQRLNDSLVGFWVENAKGDHVGPFHSMAAEGSSGGILGHDDPSALLWLPINGDPVTVTMVMDPRGSVHVATGVLPMKEMTLRLRDFQKPLQHLSSWYLQAPLLQPSTPLHSPAAGGSGTPEPTQAAFFASPPAEPGLTWRWVEAATDINATDTSAAADASADTETDDDKGSDQPQWQERHHFHPMRTRAHLESPSELREGWLVLDHAPESPTADR